MSLRISRTDGKIGIETTPAKLEITKRDARLSLRRNHVEIRMKTEHPKVEIDQYEAFASAGLKNSLDLAKEAARKGYRQVMEFIAKYARDGDMLAAIENGGNPLADIAERDAFPTDEYGLGFIPQAGPDFKVHGNLKIDAAAAKPEASNGIWSEYEPGEVNINYTRGKVNIYLKQRPSINIEFRGKNVDSKI